MAELKTFYRYFPMLLFVLILFVSFLLVQPYITAILAAFILAYIFHPVYLKFNKVIKNKSLASFVLIVLIFLILIIPLFFLTSLLVDQSVQFFLAARNFDIGPLAQSATELFGENIDVQLYFNDALNKGLVFVLNSASNFALTIPQKVISLFIVIIMLYYLLIEWNKILDKAKDFVPLNKKDKAKVFKDLGDVMYASVYGVIIIAIIQGLIGMFGLFIFDVQSPFLWGFAMIITSMLPYFGSSLIWLPISLFKIFNGDYFNGFGLLLYGVLIISMIDNFIRPGFIRKRAEIHPILVLIGVLGGIRLFGFFGVIIGPVLLAFSVFLLESYLKYYKEG